MIEEKTINLSYRIGTRNFSNPFFIAAEEIIRLRNILDCHGNYHQQYLDRPLIAAKKSRFLYGL